MVDKDIIIAGGGVAGLTLASLLAKSGFDVAVIDKRSGKPPENMPPSGRTVALMQSSLNIIRAAGVYETCEKHGGRLERMRIIDDSHESLDPVETEFDAADIGFDCYGINAPNNILHAALIRETDALDNIETIAPDALSDYTAETGKVLVRLESGREITARLLVGADGATSTVRHVAGIECWQKSYGQTAITFLMNHSHAHNGSATEFHRAGGPFAIVPLPGNASSVVWVEKDRDIERLQRLRREDFIEELQDRTKNILGPVTLETSPEHWPLRSLRAETLISKRMALVAEAAHVMSPITAQGLNLSLRDVAALAETLTDAHRLGLDIGSDNVLEKYEKRRRLDVKSRVFGVHTLNSLVGHEFGGTQALRRLSLKAINNVVPLKEFAMRQGLAPPVDTGRLARGEAL